MWMLLWAACGGPTVPQRPVVVVYGSQAQGEIEPCGCPTRPLGGLARRNTVVARERAAGPVVVVEAGDSLAPIAPAPTEGADGAEVAPGPTDSGQRQVKADLIAAAWEAGGIDGIALGAEDWGLGTAFVRGLVDQHHLPLLAANLTCGGSAPYPSGKVVEVEGAKIGLVGVTDGSVDGCVVGPPIPALKQAVEALGPVDLVIALAPYATDRELSGHLTEPIPVDVVVDARGRAAVAGPEYRGDTFFVGAGAAMHVVSRLKLDFVPGAHAWMAEGETERLQKVIDSDQGRVTGLTTRLSKMPADDPTRAQYQRQLEAYQKQLVELTRQAGNAAATGTNRFSLSSVDLDDQIPDDPAVAPLVVAAKAKILELAGGAGVAAFVPRLVTDQTSPYAGTEACVSCHKAEHAQWSTTKHAGAWQGLVTKDRALDEECWSCHVTGASQPGGPATAAAAGPFHDVQCEACHGPGRAHVADPKKVALVADPPEEVCRGCHDGKRDEGRFDFATYRPRIVHTP